MPDLSTTIAGIQLKNPVLTASGTFGYGEEFGELIDLNALGGFVVKGLSIDTETSRARLGNLTGGLSGPAIKPVAVRMVYQVVQNVKIPVIGIGGIRSAEDALEFLLAGARAIEIGTANFLDPQTPIRVIKGLSEYCRRKKIESIGQIIGAMKM